MAILKKLIIEVLHENIGDAVSDLADRLKTDNFSDKLLKDVADDNGVNPVLLNRMFIQKYNKEPKDFVVVDIKDKIIDAAKRMASDKRSKFTGELSKYVGKVFSSTGLNTDYVFVAWTGKAIHAIRIPDQKEYILTFANIVSASAFISSEKENSQ